MADFLMIRVFTKTLLSLNSKSSKNLVEFGEYKFTSLLSFFTNIESLLKPLLTLVEVQAVLVELMQHKQCDLELKTNIAIKKI
jgi:hypothetical protein